MLVENYLIEVYTRGIIDEDITPLSKSALGEGVLYFFSSSLF